MPALDELSDTDMVGSTEMQKWFDELNRLVKEAADRFANGEVLPTLASLAAVPSVHMTLVDHCRGAVNDCPEHCDAAPSFAAGLYL